MKNIFFNEEVLAAEKEICTSLNIPALILMENAGANSAKHIIHTFPTELNNEVIILTGKGNNAGDGFVIARHLLNKNIFVKVIMVYAQDELKGDSLVNFNILKKSNASLLKIVDCKFEKNLKKEIIQENKIIIDAIFGVGFKGELDIRIKNIIESINDLKARKLISLDIPSGLYSFNQTSECVKANVTLTMGVKKFSSLFDKGKESSGIKKLIDIGISENEFTIYNKNKIFELEETDVKKILPRREINSNKYSNGKVFILAGSRGLTGAAYLCSLSALRTGSGAVITGTPRSVNDILEIKLTEIITIPLSETKDSTLSLECYDEIKNKLNWADSILIGPGISKNEDTLELVRKIVKENDLKFVIDADGISAFKGNLNQLRNKNYKIILTPHYGEFSNLIGVDIDTVRNDFYYLSKNFAKEYNVILVLKNAPTIITDGNSFFINPTGKENLASVGTGDVLSGIISSLYSQKDNAFDSAIAGCYLHGMCGDRLYDIYGSSSLIASDLINEIPFAKMKLVSHEN